MWDVRRHKHEIARVHFDIILIILTKINSRSAGQEISAGFGLAVVMWQRTEAWRIAGFAKPDLCRRGILRPDAGDEHQPARLICLTAFLTLTRYDGTIIRR